MGAGNAKHSDLDLDLSCNYDLFVTSYAYVKTFNQNMLYDCDSSWGLCQML